MKKIYGGIQLLRSRSQLTPPGISSELTFSGRSGASGWM